MSLRTTIRFHNVPAALAAATVFLAGCPAAFPPGDDTTPFADVVTEEAEPNGDFGFAVDAAFDSQKRAQLEGSVSQAGDIDVFALGAVAEGDRLTFDAKTPGSSLDVSIAVFDAEGRLAGENDDVVLAVELDAFLELVVRHAGAPYYIAVSHSAFAGTGQIRGSYRVDVQLTTGGSAPPPVGQRLLLDFDGAQVNSDFLGTFSLPPFDSGDIAAVYEGETEVIKARIVEVFEQNYERFNVTIFTTDDAALPMEPYSSIFFGGFDQQAFGLAENVDLYNVDFCDDAVIFAESFTPDLFARIPSADELGLAIGNVAAHEAGHLLGLNHTDDDLDLMDARSPAQAFIADQEFMEAPLSSDIIPIGTQDGVLLLSEIVGAVEGSEAVTQALTSRPQAQARGRFGSRVVQRSTAGVIKTQPQRVAPRSEE